MSIYYSSEADLCLLRSQLCLLTIFCFPEKIEDWGQSEKWGEGRQRRPKLKLQGRHNWIIQVKQEVCSWDQPEVRGVDANPHRPGQWAPSGVGWAGWSLSRVSLRLLLWGPARALQALLRPLCFAARRPVSCPPLSSSYRLSFLDSLGCHRPGWRHRHHKTFLAARELSLPRPPPLALG